MARRRFIPIHDRGRVLIDVAVMLADGGESISDIGVLRHQSEALGPVASAPTVWRTLDEVTAGKRKKIQVARARTRRHVWSQLPGGVPASTLKNFYQVLVDTFIGYWIHAYRGTTRKRLLTTPRFLFFDLGVRNAAAEIPAHRGILPQLGGPLLEQWVGLELVHRAQYAGLGHRVGFWRTASGAEVDFVWETPEEHVPVEVKWTDAPAIREAKHVETFLDLHGDKARRGLVVCRVARAQQLTERTVAIPWYEL